MPPTTSRQIARPPFNRARQPPNPLPAHTKSVLAMAMAWASGFVDVVGWLLLYHVYTSHMTGNTSSFGIHVAGGHWTGVLHHAWPLVPFVLGLLFSALTTAVAQRLHWHSSFSIALAAELVMRDALSGLASDIQFTANCTRLLLSRFIFWCPCPPRQWACRL